MLLIFKLRIFYNKTCAKVRLTSDLSKWTRYKTSHSTQFIEYFAVEAATIEVINFRTNVMFLGAGFLFQFYCQEIKKKHTNNNNNSNGQKHEQRKIRRHMKINESGYYIYMCATDRHLYAN